MAQKLVQAAIEFTSLVDSDENIFSEDQIEAELPQPGADDRAVIEQALQDPGGRE